jgi:hypothetical protein
LKTWKKLSKTVREFPAEAWLPKEKTMIRFLRFSDAGFAETFQKISERGETTPSGVVETVQEILADVRKRGDAALCEYTERFDRLKLEASTLEVSAAEIEQALAAVDKDTLATLQLAADRIAAFHEKQKEVTWLSDDEPDLQRLELVKLSWLCQCLMAWSTLTSWRQLISLELTGFSSLVGLRR